MRPVGPQDEALGKSSEDPLRTVEGGVVVDVGVAERAAGDGIAADADARHGPDGGEHLEELGLREPALTSQRAALTSRGALGAAEPSSRGAPVTPQ